MTAMSDLATEGELWLAARLTITHHARPATNNRLDTRRCEACRNDGPCPQLDWALRTAKRIRDHRRQARL